MYKKISVLVAMIALLGVVQHAKCKKMFEKTRARVQEKYGAWKEKRQQKKEVGLPGAPKAAPAKKEEPGILKRAFRAAQEYPQRRKERKEGKEVGRQFREKQQKEIEQKKRDQEAARQQPIRAQIEKKQQEAHAAFESKSKNIGALRTQLAAEREKPHSPQKFQKIKQYEEAIAEGTRQRDLARHTAQREWEALQQKLSP